MTMSATVGATSAGTMQRIPIADIKHGLPSTHMTKRQKSALYHSIRKSGIVQPIVVRDTAAGPEIVDGHWRFYIAHILGSVSVDTINVGAISSQEAAELALALNLSRGKPTSRGLVALLEQAILGLTSTESVERVVPLPGTIQDVVTRLKRRLTAKSIPSQRSWISFRFDVDHGAARVCDDALTMVEQSTGCTRHVAFERICADFLAGNNPGAQP